MRVKPPFAKSGARWICFPRHITNRLFHYQCSEFLFRVSFQSVEKCEIINKNKAFGDSAF
jgi:hypothetical protein